MLKYFVNKEKFNIFALNLIKANMKLKNEITTEVIDNQTGEIIKQTTSKTFSVKTTSEEFYFTFLSLIKDIIGLKSIVDIKVLYMLCNHAEFNTGIVGLTPNKRSEFMSELNITYHTLANSLTRLKQLGFISPNRGDVTINPLYFWKGDLKTREQLLKSGGKLSLNIEFEHE